MMKRGAIALLIAGTLEPQPRPVTLDAFENISAWRPQPADGVSLRISSDSGFRGRAMPPRP